MRVCIVNALFDPFTGGVEKHLHSLAKFLARRGVEVHIMTGRLKGTKPEEVVDGIFIHRIPCTEIRVPGIYPPPMILAPNAYSELRKLDEKHNFDVIHLQDRWFTDFSVSASYAKNAGKPLVVTLHNARTVGIAPHYTLIGGAFDLAIGRQTLAMADKIISVSKWAIGDIGKYGLSQKRFQYIPNGIDTKEIVPREDPAFRKKFGVGDAPLAIFVGRLIKQKGLEYLLLAWKNVHRDLPDARLAIIGRGNEEARLKALCKKHGIETSVIFPGYVTEDELKSALHSCDCFTLPSLWEVLPIAILEAMAAGKPVVCTSVGGNPELVKNGVNGFLVKKRDPTGLAKALAKVLSDKKLARKMGRASRAKAVREYDWRIVARKTHVLYTKLIAEFKAGKHKPVQAIDYDDLRQVSHEFRSEFRAGRKEAATGLERYLARFRHAVERITKSAASRKPKLV